MKQMSVPNNSSSKVTQNRKQKRQRHRTSEVKPKSKTNGGNKKKKNDKKKNFGLTSQCHQEMLSKITRAVVTLELSAFQETIADLKSDILNYVNRPLIPPTQAYFLICLVSRIAETSTDLATLSIISGFCQSTFLHEQLSVHLLTWRKNDSVKELKETAECCLKIFERALRTFPLALQEVQFADFRKFIDFLKISTLSERLDIVETVRYHHAKSRSTHCAAPTSSNSKMELLNKFRVTDFRQLSTIPIADDINIPAQQEELKPVIKYGPYKSGEEYLDTTYRLLREDLVTPLRELVTEYKTSSKRHVESLFEKVQVLYPICTYRGITYRISFDTSKLRGIQWENSKKLIFGSLLCFSNDGYKTMIFGTVADRNTYLLRMGELDVRFGCNEELSKYLKGGHELCMMESPSFFEAYRHAMDCFKELNPFKLPMKRYIVECNTDIQVPLYLKQQPRAVYDLTSCFGVTKEKDKTLYSVCKNVSLLNRKKPWNFKIGLNQSQVEAVKHALTNEFALIQGPPGTGKTYCGLRIAHALLVNKKFWNPSGDTPMVIVAYTNHALDQFLTGLIEFGHKSILRIGSRYAENLEPFSMDVAKQKFRTRINKNGTHKDLRYMKHVLYEARDEFASDLGPYMMSVKKTQEAVKRGKLVPYKQIKYCMEKRHAAFFREHEKDCTQLQITIFDIFLGLCKIPTSILNNLSRKSVYHNTSPGKQQHSHESYLYHSNLQQTSDSQTIKVFGEGNALTERWVIDENEYKASYNIDTTEPEDGDGQDEDDGEESYFMDENGFQLVTMSYRDKQRKVRQELSKVEPMTCLDVKTVQNPWDLTMFERWRLYKYWLGLYMEDYNEEIALLMQQYEDTCQQAQLVLHKEQELIIKSKDVVAMTTSCASRYRNVLGRIKPKIIIVEEAAEVMEAHVISALLSSTEHCILIGDHKQLRPNPSVYDLAEKYGLDMSLFERMVENNMKCVTLNVQHRMRPQISFQLRHIYPELKNHTSVMGYEDIKGVAKNLFFINHCERESVDYKSNSSKSNIHEAKFLQALCFYFLQQGYEPSQITVLTGYSGQLLKLKSVMPNHIFEGVKVTSVDNFQGEENDIILLSLVRSNQKNSIGFLKIENRICVALSRAKKGLYVIGNFDLLGQQCSIWKKIIDDVKNQDCYGDSLTLVCQKHPRRVVEVSEEKDFEQAPEGGCMEICNFKLSCLHLCKSHCHPHDPNHEFYECQMVCHKQVCQNLDHSCERQCHMGEDCGLCQIPMERTFDCGHTQYIPCSLDTSEAFCQVPCDVVLSCGHICSNTCGQDCTREADCEVLLKKSLSCGHTTLVACNIDRKDAECDADCTIILHCGHTCNGNCSSCQNGKIHAPCQEKCGKVFKCGHTCSGPCGHTCYGCEEQCDVGCEHGWCDQTCNKECTPCEKVCGRSCPHKQCKLTCAKICDIQPCNEPCDMILLTCQHGCLGLCGEVCPEICRICHRNSGMFVDLPPETRFITLEDCGHIFQLSIIDELFKKWPNEISVKCCPTCHSPIINTPRYKRYVMQIKKDIHKIESFHKKKDRKLATQITNEVYTLCHAIAKSICNSLTKHDRFFKDYKHIAKSSTLKQFQQSLNLTYLARQESHSSKPYLLLVAERLLESASTVDAARLNNQMEIIQFVYDFKQASRESGDLTGLDSFLGDVMDPKMSIQQAKDYLLQVERVFLHMKTTTMLTIVQEQIRNGSIEKYKETENNLTRLLKVLRSFVFLDQSYLDNTFDFLQKTAKQFSLKVMTIKRRTLRIEDNDIDTLVWYRCEKNHLYTLSEPNNIQCPKCEKENIDRLSTLFHDLSLNASNSNFVGDESPPETSSTGDSEFAESI